MSKNILLPTDFSDNAWSAITYALKLYENESCTFYFINSFKSGSGSMSSLSNKLSRVMKESANKDMQELKRKARIVDANEKHNFETILSSESLLEAIHTVTTTHKIDMVVMGTKGASKTKEIFFGSNTVNVLNKIKSCPVLAVPDGYSFVTPSQIAFPTDYNKQYTDKILSPIKALSALYHSKIRILHIEEEKELSETQNTNIKKLENDLSGFDCSFHWVPGYDQKTSVIVDFIKELEINILVLVNNKHSFIENIINEPVVKKIGFSPIIPFLVIPE
ncbi:universal stress protein [Lacinutrix sp. C3R15]|uniref:universal stress protein n=1 Tax=Flavobacteriaceae TaxID=49546 RepID=UPI001C08F2CC|nr:MULTISPECIES: universal stress protein [Flavobacteriaceae]MBU2939767.1 universal stress protein [Lacinutrix sp. C3R15]MDO6623082.1 universal stress protein [Oceanihabitans sp. 1_MG-2023]